MSRRTRPGDIYRRAAKYHWIRRDWCPSCTAIQDEDIWDGGHAHLYAKLFKPHPRTHPGDAWGLRWGRTPEEVQMCRSLALCFMAAIADAEEA